MYSWVLLSLSECLLPLLFPLDAAQLSWVKWRQGLMLQYGNITLMLIEELKGGLFLQKDSDGIKILRDDKWELHRWVTLIGAP